MEGLVLRLRMTLTAENDIDNLTTGFFMVVFWIKLNGEDYKLIILESHQVHFKGIT